MKPVELNRHSHKLSQAHKEKTIMAKFDPDKMKKDNATAKNATEDLKKKRKKSPLRKFREKLIAKSGGKTVGTQEKQIKELKL